MKISEYLQCEESSPCDDVEVMNPVLPDIEVDKEKIQVVMITEAPPRNIDDYFYSGPESFFFKTVSQAFKDAGKEVASMEDLLDLGIYLTTAIKCPKARLGVSTQTTKNCLKILKKEIDLFPRVKVYMLMGDVAIKAFNYIAKAESGQRVIPNISTYKIRQDEYFYQGKRVFPSYVITGGNFLIEKSKRKMVADDLRRMFDTVRVDGKN